MANPHAPVANDDFFDVNEFQSTSGNVILGNLADGFVGGDTDGDGADTLRVTEVNGSEANLGQEVHGTKGTLVLGSNGEFSYENDDDLVIAVGSTVTDAFTYKISDRPKGNNEALFDDAVLTITITGVADGNENNNHLLASGAGNTLTGFEGDDILDGAGGSDTLFGGDGTPDVSDGNDTLNGNGGADFIFGGFSGVIDGGAGSDTIVDGAGDTSISGGDDSDTITAGGGTDMVFGGGSDDRISVGILIANVGADPIAGETWDGGAGKDQLNLNLGPGTIAQNKWVIDLTSVTIENFESLSVGSQAGPNGDFKFTLKMTSSQFNAFDSIIFPTSLDHTFQIVGNGKVTLPATMGNGEKIQLNSADNLLDGSAMKSGAVSIRAGGGDDKVIGSQSATLFTVFLDNGDDTFTGNAANEEAHGGKDADTLAGKTGIDRLFGENDDDKLDGGVGADILVGGSGKDRLTGGAGKDFLQGDAGADRLEGGAEADRFVFLKASDSPEGRNHDTIVDFRHKEDKIDLSDVDANKEQNGVQHFDFIGKDDFNKTAGELRLDGKDLLGDLDGDGEADFEIGISGNAPGEGDLVLV